MLTPKEGHAVQEVATVMKKMAGYHTPLSWGHVRNACRTNQRHFGRRADIGRLGQLAGAFHFTVIEVRMLANYLFAQAPEETAKTSPFAELVADSCRSPTLPITMCLSCFSCLVITCQTLYLEVFTQRMHFAQVRWFDRPNKLSPEAKP